MSEQVEMSEIPLCNFCEDEEDVIIPEPAFVDARTRFGPWAYMCRIHWQEYGQDGRLGTGFGQRLVLRP